MSDEHQLASIRAAYAAVYRDRMAVTAAVKNELEAQARTHQAQMKLEESERAAREAEQALFLAVNGKQTIFDA